ncbi:MAG: DNA starvation/stationary phase protection protein Dps [Myxococcota bacterium]
MSATYPTKIDLPADTRARMVDLLNQNLALAIDLSLQAKQAHWNVKGPAFQQLHELFDKTHALSTGFVDTLAERAVILGGVAAGTLQVVSEASTLPAYRLDLAAGRDHVDALSTALAAFGRSARAAIRAAEEAGDADTADVFTEVSRATDKQLWFVEAHLHADR